MSRRTTWCAALALTSLLCSSTPVSSQSNEAELLERIERLRVEVDEAGRAAADAVGRLREQEAARARVPTERVRVGPFEILAVADQADLAAELFEEVWREDFAGLDGSPALDGSVFAFEWWSTRPAGIYMYPSAPGEDGPVVHRIEVNRAQVPRRDGLKPFVRSAVWSALREDFPQEAPIRIWTQSGTVLTTSEVYRSLATMTQHVANSCIGEDTRACMVGLGFEQDVTQAELAEWFTPFSRRTLVVRASAPWSPRVDVNDPSVRACIDDDDIAACDRVLLALGSLGVARTPREANIHLLFHALRVGGEGAWARALESPSASVAEVLERASGQDIDGLVAAWRTELSETDSVAYAGIGVHAAVTVLWVLILAALAMRSTRWRLA